MQNDKGILVVGYSIGLIILSYFSFTLITINPPWIVIDNANLAIHEGGHLIFSPFGQFIHVLGGSLFQILVPILFFCYFFYQKQAFSTLFCLFWTGNNLINVATYIKDARAMVLPLLGNGEHDWHWLLSTLHLLEFDYVIGTIVFLLGVLCLILSLLGILLLIITTFANSVNKSMRV